MGAPRGFHGLCQDPYLRETETDDSELQFCQKASHPDFYLGGSKVSGSSGGVRKEKPHFGKITTAQQQQRPSSVGWLWEGSPSQPGALLRGEPQWHKGAWSGVP